MNLWPIAFLTTFYLISQGTATPSNEVTAYVTGVADLKCRFENTQNTSLHHLRFVWEKEKAQKVGSGNHVVAELNKGERIWDHVTDIFKNRTIEIMPNGDLQISDITLEDEGKYLCYVFKQIKDSVLEHIEIWKLIILANFSVPHISSDSHLVMEQNSVVNFHCSSSNGFPKPYGIYWVITDENGTHSHYIDCNLNHGPLCNIRSNSRTFHIFSNFTWTVKSNISITCTVVAHHNVSSKALHVGIRQKLPPPSENDNLKYIIAAVIIIGIITVFFVYFGCRRKRKMCGLTSSRRHGEPANTMDSNNLPETGELLSIGKEAEVNVS
ncbi:T-lymphocyte activation antigen CD86 [Dendropsophus ebraccatus]|uniref:T-lymphocyte activation antigen CD86 n=1 Tax=Dendropsophus ebraccatus TaxID=150705 RepID=UPI0038318725